MEVGDKLPSKAKSAFGSVVPIVMTTVTHPIHYAKLLIQLGHEPIPPREVTTFWGKKVVRLPNVIQYVGHIRQIDGWFGLYRGVGPRVAHNVISLAVANAINHKVKEDNEKAGSLVGDVDSVYEFLRETVNLSVAQSVGTVVSYPFYLISVRMMAQFIGRETQYTSILSSVREIYNEDGFTGFFTGLIPHMVGELVALCSFRVLNYMVLHYVIPNTIGPAEDHQMAEIRGYSKGVCQYAVSMMTYPFHLVANIMAVNGTKLSAGQPPIVTVYSSWTDCWVDLGKKGLRNRGSALFRRNMPAVCS